MTKRFLSYLPSSVYEAPPVLPPDPADPADRRDEELLTLIPRKRTTTFDIRRAIALLADADSFFEIGPLWGTDQVTGFVRCNGHPLGVIASDSRHVNGGAMTADGCSKLTRHLDVCDLFHIPILNLVDNPGFAVGLEHETAGTIRRGGEWMIAFAQVSVPIFTVLMRRSFGVAGNNFATPQARPSVRVAWPAADVGGIPPEGGIEAAYKRQLAEAADPAALRAELEARIESARGPVGPLNRFQIEEMIDPRDTRRCICEWVENAYRSGVAAGAAGAARAAVPALTRQRRACARVRSLQSPNTSTVALAVAQPHVREVRLAGSLAEVAVGDEPHRDDARGLLAADRFEVVGEHRPAMRSPTRRGPVWPLCSTMCVSRWSHPGSGQRNLVPGASSRLQNQVRSWPLSNSTAMLW